MLRSTNDKIVGRVIIPLDPEGGVHIEDTHIIRGIISSANVIREHGIWIPTGFSA